MAILGWECIGWTKSGAPNKFKRTLWPDEKPVYIRTTLGERWRAERSTGYMVELHKAPPFERCDALDTPHPKSAFKLAAWLLQEFTNGNRYRIAKSENRAGDPGTVLCGHPAEPERDRDSDTV